MAEIPKANHLAWWENPVKQLNKLPTSTGELRISAITTNFLSDSQT